MSLCLFASTASVAANWDDLTLRAGNPVVVVGYEPGDELIVVDEAAIPIDEFERAGADDSDIAKATKRAEQNSRNIATLTDSIVEQASDLARLEQSLDSLSQELDEAAALSAALDFQRPLAGKRLRLGVGGGTYDDEAAVGVSLTGASDRFDFGAGFAFSENEALGKGSVGFSFW